MLQLLVAEHFLNVLSRDEDRRAAGALWRREGRKEGNFHPFFSFCSFLLGLIKAETTGYQQFCLCTVNCPMLQGGTRWHVRLGSTNAVQACVPPGMHKLVIEAQCSLHNR